MNNTTTFAASSPYGLGQGGRIGGFGYGIGVSVGLLFLITTITLASYFCTRTPPPPPSHARRRTHHGPPNPSAVDVEAPGLDEEVLNGYPKLLYSQAKLREEDSTASCCSICLADYKDSDVLRVLPDCGHLFHMKCVDAWLRLHPTCPVCRSSPLPTPLSTPLAEVVPLARSAS
ncbi:RING-H2 finger protein ATL70 [Acorus gramineus]|uniref:RING-type E3 ubiquitin transferase n=1 Tax=Acorus gramineus TaxID=55184 RepID=A0AAV9B5I1_ACOGR|nr:RING-H2 finger protein ATL70 [Acorus gramineus]